MPTPSESSDDLSLQLDPTRATCPPESVDRTGEWRVQVLNRLELAASDAALSAGAPRQTESTHDDGLEGEDPMDTSAEPMEKRALEQNATVDLAAHSPLMQSSSPPCSHGEEKEVDHVQPLAPTSSALELYYSRRYGIESSRLIQTHTSLMLHGGSKFRGTQTSDQQQYKVEVDIKSVDMAESFICGYLKIEGLTPEHATLTTYFEGEIIGPRYTFQTRHDSWGASEKDDIKHWGNFPAWKPLANKAKKADFHYKNSTNRENMFMRWKEKFLVPDHRVREISGASFEGFYYICFNQVIGAISGIYYHSKSDQHNSNKIQRLELKWVNDRGCFSAMEFR